MIKGKKLNDEDEAFIYKTPFDNFLPCTPNLVDNNTESFSLKPTGIDEEGKETPDSVGIWTKSELTNYNKDFNRLGLRADFSSLLHGYNITQGDYGLKLEITYEKKDNDKEGIYIEDNKDKGY